MTISFFVTRIVLERLGVEDYGIYNVVGGMVSMFAIFSSALTSAITRFITFELGQNHQRNLKLNFSTSMTILICLAILFIIVSEPLGIWFINDKMRIAPERIGAAHWVFQCSIITFAINLISIPYNALIIAHEKMKAFAYISMLEVGLKLLVAFALFIPYFDTLKLYAVMLALVALCIRFVYASYAAKNFDETHTRLIYNKEKCKEILSFTGWTCIGGSASILNNQGVNVLLNIFFGTAINAARGITTQVNNAIWSFSSNFMVAVNPQIIKSYASGDFQRTEFLVFQSARLSLYLIMFLSLPVLIETKFLLNIWLTSIPAETVIFIRILLLQTILESISIPLQYLNQATGNIKIYQIIAGGILLLNFPISWLFLKLGFSAQSVYYVALVIAFVGLIGRLSVLSRQTGLNARKFFVTIFLKGVLVFTLSVSLPFVFIHYYSENTLHNILGLIICVLWSCLIIWTMGLSKAEKHKIVTKVRTIIQKRHAKISR